jgi:catechol 2,3-dioxygenase-like lactoylglutathione lyase family enzyme
LQPFEGVVQWAIVLRNIFSYTFVRQLKTHFPMLLQPYDLAIPILPSRSVNDTVAFYKRLGFDGGAHEFDSGYAILRRGGVELHFFTHSELVPAESSAGCYIRVTDVESFYRTCLPSHLPSTGIPRMDALEDKPWGLREFAVVDPDGNLVRIGQVIEN